MCTCSVAHRKRTLSVEFRVQEGAQLLPLAFQSTPQLQETFKTCVSTVLENLDITS